MLQRGAVWPRNSTWDVTNTFYMSMSKCVAVCYSVVVLCSVLQ